MIFKLPVWAEINTKAINKNIREIRKLLKSEVSIMAVVKANGYGHGAVKAAITAVNSNVDYLGVSRISEAIELREAGIQTPIIIFGYTSPMYTELLLHYDITQTIYDINLAEEYASAAVKLNKRLKIHIKVDTGMGRLGFFIPNFDNNDYKTYLKAVIKDIEAVNRLKGLEAEGIYTHLATSEIKNYTYTKNQLAKFREVLELTDRLKIKFRYIHSANSMAIFNYPDSHFNMVRPGIAIYGVISDETLKESKIHLIPSMQIKAVISHVKTVPAGSKISYGSIYTTKRPIEKIATIPIGYADGYKWVENPKGSILIHGKKAPITGRICMDFLMADVTDIEEVKTGDEAVIIGTQGKETLSVLEVAEYSNTTPYEVISSLTARIPKINVT